MFFITRDDTAFLKQVTLDPFMQPSLRTSFIVWGPRQVDNEKKTALHWSVCSASKRTDKVEAEEELNLKLARAKLCVQILLEAAGHTANWKDYEGRTALHLGKN